MTRFVVDAGAVLQLLEGGIEVASQHELVAPTLLRSQVLSLLHEAGWASTYDAEYVALTLLQADALVTLDEVLKRSVEGIVATAPIHSIGASNAVD